MSIFTIVMLTLMLSVAAAVVIIRYLRQRGADLPPPLKTTDPNTYLRCPHCEANHPIEKTTLDINTIKTTTRCR